MSARRLRMILAASLALGLPVGCEGAGCSSEEVTDGTNVTVVASPISHNTIVPFFTMGHDLEYLPFGGIGVLNTGTSWTASIEFIDVPEGKYVPRYDGYGALASNITGVGPVQSYCQIEWGIDVDQLSVVSGGRNRSEIVMSSVPGCDRVGVSHFIANPRYDFDASHPFAGATDGENIIAVYVDGAEAFSDIHFLVCDEDIGQDCADSPFGIFPDLPNPPDTLWPDPDDWETESMLIPTESHGDLAAYLVVKPNATPTLWEVNFEDEENNTERIHLRVSNMNTIAIAAP